MTDSSSKNEEKEVEARELSPSLSTLDEKGEGNFISNSSRTQETQNEREKLLSSSLKEGEGGERLSFLTISNEKEVRFGKNGGEETIEKGYLTTSSMSKEELENVRILRKR